MHVHGAIAALPSDEAVEVAIVSTSTAIVSCAASRSRRLSWLGTTLALSNPSPTSNPNPDPTLNPNPDPEHAPIPNPNPKQVAGLQLEVAFLERSAVAEGRLSLHVGGPYPNPNSNPDPSPTSNLSLSPNPNPYPKPYAYAYA